MIDNLVRYGGESEFQRKKRLRKVAAATIVGSMLEWYRFLSVCNDGSHSVFQSFL